MVVVGWITTTFEEATMQAYLKVSQLASGSSDVNIIPKTDWIINVYQLVNFNDEHMSEF